MITTGRKLCTRAMRLIEVVSGGETPEGTELNDAFDVLNDMMDGWAIDHLLIYNHVRTLFNYQAGKQAYTLGSGGDFNASRPEYLTRASTIYNGIEYTIKVWDIGEWQRVPLKTTQSNIPLHMYHDNAYPLMNCNFWPTPQVLAQVALYLPVHLAQFTDLDTEYDFQHGVVRALRYNLALDLAAEWGQDPPPIVVAKAAEYLGDVRRSNITPETIGVDSALVGSGGGGHFNWFIGESQ